MTKLDSKINKKFMLYVAHLKHRIKLSDLHFLQMNFLFHSFYCIAKNTLLTLIAKEKKKIIRSYLLQAISADITICVCIIMLLVV